MKTEQAIHSSQLASFSHSGIALRPSTVFLALYVLSMPVYCLIRIWGSAALVGIATAATAAFLFLFSLSHCIETRGLRRSALMLGAAFAIALLMEYLGSRHGFIFGNYTYTDNLGYKALGQVPVIIPVAWFMMLYPSWETAGLLTGRILHRVTKGQGDTVKAPPFTFAPFLRVLLAALAMTAWDLSLDPRMVADGNWIWHDGGAYFGIPLSNFAGWIITSAMIYAVWALLDKGEWRLSTGDSSAPTPITSLQSQLPIWAYIITWIGESMANALFWGGPLVALCVWVAMGLFGAPALLILIRHNRAQHLPSSKHARMSGRV
jgi:putative membrane protein